MPLPNSGPISLQDIQNEFGGSNPIGLSEYYRGGQYVPVTPSTINIPVAGPIDLGDFYGASNYIVRVLTGSSATLGFLGNGSNIVAMTGGTTSSVSTNNGVNWTTQSGNSSTMGNNAVFVTGTTGWRGANHIPGYQTVRVQNVFSPTITTNTLTVAGTGGNGWFRSVASNGSMVVLSGGNAGAGNTGYFEDTSNPTAATPTWNRRTVSNYKMESVNAPPSVFQYHAPQGVWLSLYGGTDVNNTAGRLFAYSTNGTSWSVPPVGVTTGSFGGVLYHDAAFKTSGGTTTMVMIGYSATNNGWVYRATGASATAILSGAANIWSGANWTGSNQAPASILWIPAANGGNGYFVILRMDGTLLRSPDGQTWTPFGPNLGTPVKGSRINLGTYSYWGSSGIWRVENAAIP